jgi:predicted ArsR family transcriptional regulator
MEDVLWYLLGSSRGGETRARILQAIDDQPRNANQLAEELDLDYTTVRYHLDVLIEDNVLRQTGDGYGDVYLPTEQAQHNWETVMDITDQVTPEES